jgi:hypothetical protein
VALAAQTSPRREDITVSCWIVPSPVTRIACRASRRREAERDHLVEAFTRTGRGRSAGVVFDAAPGLGRSRLLDEAATLARRLGVRTVSVDDLGGDRAVQARVACASSPPSAARHTNAGSTWAISDC